MENVSGEHQAPESHVDGEHPAVTRIASVFHAAVVFLFLKLDEFAVKGFRIVRAVVFHVDPGIEHKLYGIAVAAQVDSPVDSGPDRVAETFAAAVIDTADEACRYRLFHLGSRAVRAFRFAQNLSESRCRAAGSRKPVSSRRPFRGDIRKGAGSFRVFLGCGYARRKKNGEAAYGAVKRSAVRRRAALVRRLENNIWKI